MGKMVSGHNDERMLIDMICFCLTASFTRFESAE